MPVPTSTHIIESAVIKAPFSDVWTMIKLPRFAEWWSALEKSEIVKGVSDEADVYRFTFKDGTVQDVKLEEHSSLDHYVTLSVISSQPALSYSSVLSTIRCYPITSGELAGSTYVTFSGNFAGDADAGVIEDGRFKRRDALKDLAAFVAK
ncbi:hypothetical protein QFC22_000788 [Naganishia vaughanmartiniae]|uniref:Uncharacterized protein n=1 Tax=Naganishia vaughanmartiniae TaxID=1424756 RepID=A0ACC2XK29_9TREE|nr:hypothetical protein QFC22_000788 [Naganishia vaughanmartiniae]